MRIPLSVLVVALAAAGACGKKPPAQPTATTQPQNTFPGSVGNTTANRPTNPSTPPAPPDAPPTVVRDTPVTGAASYDTMSTDQINANSPLKPVYFLYDSDELSDAARSALSDNAALLKQYSTWVITLEGHCDERGTAEYNLALGDRRAQVVRAYLVTLGVNADRLHTVSYGKEFPLDPGHDEAAYSKNRRAHFIVTAKESR